ncbi:MAG: DUF359 domain-containing protein [Promethearchaeota archaeon]
MEHNLKVPNNLRFKFAEPLDILIAGTREETLIQVESIFRDFLKSNKNPNFYIVGDIVAKDFFTNPFLKSFIKVCIIDEKTQRNHIEINFEGFFEDIIEFQNLEGSIQKESWDLFKSVIDSDKRTLIKITEGEEDLLVLPLILGLPIKGQIKNFVFYGQPPITDSEFIIPEGIVIVDVDEKIQKKVKQTIALMEKF